MKTKLRDGLTKTQAVSWQLLTTEARIQCQTRPYGIYRVQNGNNLNLLMVFRFFLTMPLNQCFTLVLALNTDAASSY